MKGIYRRVAIIILLAVLCGLSRLFLHSSLHNVHFYINRIFLPYQKFRNNFLNHTSISIGDYLYLLLAFGLLLLLVRLVYYAITIGRNKIYFFAEMLKIFIFGLSIYFVFFISWGGNYYRPGLGIQWEQQTQKNWDARSLLKVNQFLIAKLNSFQRENLKFPDLETLNIKANDYYHQQFSEALPELKVKVTTLGYLLNYAGVHGYYNPLSGESQFNRNLPGFMHPFVITHQAGIAAEDDANLLAYMIGVRSKDYAFQYSAYFNIFLYAFSDLETSDPAEAKIIWSDLNQRSKNDYAALLAIYQRYKSFIRGASNDLYDYYLKWNGQQKGLDSYNMVVKWVYFWEFETKEKADLIICPSS